MLLFIFLGFAGPVAPSKWLTPLETVALKYTCGEIGCSDPHEHQLYPDTGCWFNETQINSTTIVHWPVNCSSVCGLVSFGRSADVPIFELKSYFKNVKVLKGYIYMYDSQYISTSFFSSVEEIYCEDFSFAGNRVLKELTFDSLKVINCTFYAYDNEILDASSFCEKFEDSVDMFVYDNLKNCKGCVSGQIDYDTIRNYANCTALVGPTIISGVFLDVSTDMSALSTVVNINGSFEIMRTDFADLSFLKSLVFVKSNHYWVPDMNIRENYEMKRLNLPSLKSLKVTDGFFTLNLESLHPDFCLTTDEIDIFMGSNVQFKNIEAVYCQNETREGVCEFEEMASLEAGCVGVLGQIVVDSGDEFHVEKLNTVKTIYGSITIQNTNLTDLNFLQSLEYIVLLNDTTTAFQILSNKNLQDVDMPSLKRVYSNSKYQISFDDNGSDLLNSTACLQFMDSLVTTNVVFDRQECEVIDRTNDTMSIKNSGNRLFVDITLMVLLVHFFHMLFSLQ